MRMFFVILSLALGVSMGCEVRPTTSQVDPTPTVSPTPNETTDVASSKAPCEFKMDQSPGLRGLRLRMTREEVLAMFRGSKEDAELGVELARAPGKSGTQGFVIRPAKYPSAEKFAGIREISFTLLDGRVSGMHATYDGPEWPHVDDFVAKFVEGTNLPPAAGWDVYVGLDDQLKTLTCKDFEIKVFAGGKNVKMNYVELRDSAADQELKKRRAKARQSPTP